MKKRIQITFPDISHKKQMIIYTFDIYFVKPILKGLFIILLNHCLILLVLQKAIGNGHRKNYMVRTPVVIPTRGNCWYEHSVLRYNNNYLFKTSVHHNGCGNREGRVKGFMPIDIKYNGRLY